MANMPAAEVDVSNDLVRALLREQHPDLADLPLVELANGWDNVIFRLGEQYSVRLPRREMAARLIAHEQRVLPDLVDRLPLPVPAPVRVGRAGEGYPWSWSITPWITGRVAAASNLDDPAREARRLGEFMAALHIAAPPDAPPNPYRGQFIGDNTPIFTERVGQLSNVSAPIIARWNELVDVAPWHGPPTWVHGDVHTANVLVDEGEVSGVIDFGDVCSGDPATDLAVAWMLFGQDDRNVFRAAAGSGDFTIDDPTWQRAEAWALHFAVTYLAHSADSPTMAGIGQGLLDTLISSARS